MSVISKRKANNRLKSYCPDGTPSDAAHAQGTAPHMNGMKRGIPTKRLPPSKSYEAHEGK